MVTHQAIFSFLDVFQSSSMVEHPAVNRRVVGSSPTFGAKSCLIGNKRDFSFLPSLIAQSELSCEPLLITGNFLFFFQVQLNRSVHKSMFCGIYV